jgi:MFS family permease
LLGTVLAAYGVPRTALLVVGGHASDRYRPWTVMLAANVARGIAVAAFSVTAAAGLAEGPLLIVIAVILGAGEGMFIPASSAIVPALLPREELQAGNALSFGTTELSQLAGPALGGVLVAVVGAASGFAIDAATFLVSALTLIGIQRDAPAPAPTTDHDRRRDAAVGTATARGLLVREPILRLILITDAMLNLGTAGMGRVALPALARGPLHLGASGYGALSAAMGAGLLVGTIAGSWLPSARRPLLIASLTLLPTVPLIAVIPYAGGWLSAALILVLAFVLVAIGNLLMVTGFQQWAPPQLLGRVTGMLMLASIGMLPVSVLLAGVLIQIIGPAAYFPLDAGTILIAAIVQLSSPTWRHFNPEHASPTTPDLAVQS